MFLNRSTKVAAPFALTPPVRYAVAALHRDIAKVFAESSAPGGTVRLEQAAGLAPECFRLRAEVDTLALAADDDLGFVYGLFEISRRFLGVQPFWFWNDQPFQPTAQALVPKDFAYESRPARVKYRGWFINDETLLSHWKVERRADLPFVMAFEALLRCGGNMVIPGTGENARRYRRAAADMGLIITHHHAEPLGAEMFAAAYPGLEAQYSKYPDKFRALWQQGIDAQKGMRVVWNIGFRGQGDRPFWEDDPQYDTPQKRGALISSLIRQQYDLVKQNDPAAVCCTNLYGEVMELYQQGYLDLPADVIKIWADNGYGKMVSRRQGNDNPRVPALPREGEGGAAQQRRAGLQGAAAGPCARRRRLLAGQLLQPQAPPPLPRPDRPAVADGAGRADGPQRGLCPELLRQRVGLGSGQVPAALRQPRPGLRSPRGRPRRGPVL